jgi:two-component system chemotaxis response regulator CheY
LLVIDDNPAFLRSLVRLLAVHGLDVAVARNGREGLAIFRRISPAVVLTDILMPVQDGISTLMAMRREQPGVKIIAMSGGGLKSDFLTVAKKLGADSTVEKPFDVGELAALIRRYLASGG